MRIVLKRWGRVYLSFWRIHSAAGATPARDQNEIKAEFEEIRQQLVSTILGLSFLITRLSLLENSTLGCGARACQRAGQCPRLSSLFSHLLADTLRKSGVIHTCTVGERGFRLNSRADALQHAPDLEHSIAVAQVFGRRE